MTPPRRQVRATGQLFAVVDDPSDAPGIVTRLAAAGIDPSEVTMLRGSEGAERIDATGAGSGIRARFRQTLSFTMVDQMPDFILYEAAVRDGRTVLAFPVRTEETVCVVGDRELQRRLVSACQSAASTGRRASARTTGVGR